MTNGNGTDSQENATPSRLKQCSNAIVTVLESGFYRHGKLVGKYPWITILLSVLVAAGFAIGMFNFTEENRREKLWIPMGSKSIDHLYWVQENFASDIRFSQFLIEGNNVLTPTVLQAMLDLDKSVRSINASGAVWETVCYEIGGLCVVSSLLELWSFNETVINNLDTSDILDMVNTDNLTSPVYYSPLDIENMIGGIIRDSSGAIISAQATTMNFLLADNRQYDPSVGDEGVSITVTSITDFVAFGIGATTILPALRSFCVYCAIGIFFLFFFCVTFFSAVLAIDQRRIKSMRNACCCCFTHQEDRPRWQCGRDDKGMMASFFRYMFANGLMKLPVKILVVIAALALVGVNIWGTISLKQEFQFEWFLPEDSYVVDYLDAQDTYFPSGGFVGNVYLRNVDYYSEYQALDELYDQLDANQYIFVVDSWYEDLREWIKKVKSDDPALGANNLPGNETQFFTWTLEFLQVTNEGRRHSDDVKISQNNITFSRINFQFHSLVDSSEEIDAMTTIDRLIKNIGFSESDSAFAYADAYPNWDAKKVIKEELYRNLGLAMAAVFIVTLILIANLWTSLLVFLCVIFTLIDVTGMMHFWGLTIDTVTTINLILAVGLAVDYSAHIGHTFMTVRGTRDRRAKYTLGDMGPAVFNGGFSTFLAFVLLIFSNSYIFKVFFKIFFLVVVFGLFHGLVFLPVMLSWIGPSPYLSAENRATEGDDDDDDKITLDTKEEKVAKAMEGITNPVFIPRVKQPMVDGEDVEAMRSNGTQTQHQGKKNGDPMSNGRPNSQTTKPTDVKPTIPQNDKIPPYGRPEIPPPDYDLPKSSQRSVRSSSPGSPITKTFSSHEVNTENVPNVNV